jgi:hypothetical protein
MGPDVVLATVRAGSNAGVKGLLVNQNSAYTLRNKFMLDASTEHFRLEDS